MNAWQLLDWSNCLASILAQHTSGSGGSPRRAVPLLTLPPVIVSRQEVAAPQLDSISKAFPVSPSELFKRTKL